MMRIAAYCYTASDENPVFLQRELAVPPHGLQIIDRGADGQMDVAHRRGDVERVVDHRCVRAPFSHEYVPAIAGISSDA
jgi:hypothetical protein